MADFNNAYGAGLVNGYIKTADGTTYDIEAIINIETDITQDDITVPGDDTVKATFSSGRREDMTITANAVSMDVIQAISGNAISSSAGGTNVALGTDSELNPPFVEVGGEVTAKTIDGTSAVVRKVWHRVQLRSTDVNAGNGNELSVVWEGTAYQATSDIAGNALASKRVATLSVVSA